MNRTNVKAWARSVTVAAGLLGLVVWSAYGQAKKEAEPAAPAPGPFASSTIDVGLVVRDVEKSIAFYKNALGLVELGSFKAPAALVTDIGLGDKYDLNVRVVATQDSETATKIKLIQIPEAPGREIDNKFLHSSYGYRYLTLFVNDMQATLDKAFKAGAEPLGKGAVPLPKGFPEGVYLAVYRDPDGNFVEVVGPAMKQQ